MKLDVYNRDGLVVGEMEVADDLLNVTVNPGLLHQVSVAYQANRRTGTAATKTRGLVRGGGRKPWRQKGTGRARQGSIRSPIWRKGGVAFGPLPRDHRQSLPKKIRRLALRGALSLKAADGGIRVLEELDFAEPRTKEMARIMANNGLGKTLVILDRSQPNLEKSVRNLPGSHAVQAGDINTQQVLVHTHLLLSKSGLIKLAECWGKDTGAKLEETLA